MHPFLSAPWFEMLQKANEDAGDLPLPEKLANLVINIDITDGAPLHIKHGKLMPEFCKDASTTIITKKDIAQKLLLERDAKAATKALMLGRLRVKGDLSQLLSLSQAVVVPEQKALFKHILTNTIL